MVDIPVLQIQWCKGMINLGLRKFNWISFSFFKDALAWKSLLDKMALKTKRSPDKFS